MRVHVIATALLAALLSSAGHWPVPAQTTGLGQSVELVDPDVLRVCADPHNMPFSNEKEEGFEQALAKLLAPKLGRKSVSYTYFPQATGFVRMTLSARRCDVIMGYPQGDELVQNTNPYYRSSYVLVFRPGTGLDGITTIEDPRLKSKKIGVVAGTPPATSLARAGLMAHVKPYQLMVDTRIANPAEAMIKDVASGVIDIAAVWGPVAGYYAAKMQPPLTVASLTKEKVGRMIYRITMGVRPSDQEWKRQLNRAISENQAEINHLLQSFGVPLLDEQNKPITD
jgi:quinoprotein dehydrogenase-associated probable ABC transporter substrate-binding protein